MAEKKPKSLKQEVQSLKSLLNKLNSSADTKKGKIQTLQSEVDEIEKEIKTVTAELSEKEAQLKKADYSSVLDKLDSATLSMLSKRQAELLTEHILAGTISALLEEGETDNGADTENEDNINTVDTNING